MNKVIKFIKIAWTKYHFIIPVKVLKRNFKSFFCKIFKIRDNSYYYLDNINDYNKWLKKQDYKIDNKFNYNPLITIIIYGTDNLEKCLDSILKQEYQNLEIIVSKDIIKNSKIKLIEELDLKKYLQKSLSLIKGEYISFINSNDLIDINAYSNIVNILNFKKNFDLIYTDSDYINCNNEFCNPLFKPDFSKDTLMSFNYIRNLSIIKKEIVNSLSNFNTNLFLYDLYLKISDNNYTCYHLAKVLYHERIVDNKSIISDTKDLLIKIIKRKKLNAKIENIPNTLYFNIEYQINDNPLVTIIIPTKDNKKILEDCINSIISKTLYKNYEIIIINNQSKEEDSINYFHYLTNKYDFIKIYDYNEKFNYSRINNYAVEKANGDYIVLLNNDTLIIDPNWLEKMLGYASLNHVGCVGVKLLYKDNIIQHAGVVLGFGGVASHVYLESNLNEIGYMGRLVVPYNYLAVTAACLMIKKDKYNEVKGLEEKLSVAYNDVDLNLKLTEKGYYNVFLPNVSLYHFESKSRGYDLVGEKLKRFEKEQEYMYNKWSKFIKNDIFYNENLSKTNWFTLNKK